MQLGPTFVLDRIVSFAFIFEVPIYCFNLSQHLYSGLKIRIMTETHEFSKTDLPKTLYSASDSPSEHLAEEDLSDEAQLPPVDRGIHAWMFLISSFVIEGLVWGEFRRCETKHGTDRTLQDMPVRSVFFNHIIRPMNRSKVRAILP